RLDGRSVRTLHVNLDEAMKEDSDQQADLVRISGKHRSEFPEPTCTLASIIVRCVSSSTRTVSKVSAWEPDCRTTFKSSRCSFARATLARTPSSDGFTMLGSDI